MFIIIFVNRKKFKKLWMRCAVCFLTQSRQRWGVIINSIYPYHLDHPSVYLMPVQSCHSGKKLCLWWDVFHSRTRNMSRHQCWLDQLSKICCCCCLGQCGCLFISVLTYRSSSPVPSPDWKHCFVFGQDTQLSQCPSPPRSICIHLYICAL